MDFYFKRKFFLTLPNAIVLIIKRYCQLKTVFNKSSIQNVKKFIANLKDQLATICLIFERYDNFYTKPYCFFFNFKNSASLKHPPPSISVVLCNIAFTCLHIHRNKQTAIQQNLWTISMYWLDKQQMWNAILKWNI